MSGVNIGNIADKAIFSILIGLRYIPAMRLTGVVGIPVKMGIISPEGQKTTGLPVDE